MNNEIAYALGFLLGDGAISNSGRLTMTIAIKDKEVVYYISNVFKKSIVKESYITNKEKKIFPNIKIAINRPEFPNARTLFGGIAKVDRNIPILPKDLEVDMVRGFFDAEGCITWGLRKDRNRIWQKVSFNSQLGMLIGIQKILIKNKISTIVKPVKNSNHYIIEFADEYDVLKFYKYLYSKDGFYLSRKKNEFENWILKLSEKYEIKTGDIVKFASMSSAIYNLPEYIYMPYKTIMQSRKCRSKSFKVIQDLGSDVVLESIATPINKLILTKQGMRLTPLRIELGELLESSFKKQSAAKPSETEGSETTGFNSDIK